MSGTSDRENGFRFTALHVGLVAGLATAVGLPLLAFAAIRWVEPRPPFNVEVLANGADISAVGGARVVIEDDAGRQLVAATCNGPCDDLGYRFMTGDSAHTVKVLDARGAEVAQGSDGYVDGASAVRMRVAGAQRLTVTSEALPRAVWPLLRQQPDATGKTQ